MSNTALTIRTDQQTKKAISDFAASVGLSTSSFMVAAAMQAVREHRLVLTSDLEPTPCLEEIMRQADADIKAGKNLSKAHADADDFLSELDKDA